jgi:hypothetical protein
MRILALILASLTAISATTLSVQAQARKSCGRICLENRIAALENEVAELNANAIKAGQNVTLNAPGGCLSWGGPTPGAVGWVPPPCFNSTWVIGGH